MLENSHKTGFGTGTGTCYAKYPVPTFKDTLEEYINRLPLGEISIDKKLSTRMREMVEAYNPAKQANKPAMKNSSTKV